MLSWLAVGVTDLMQSTEAACREAATAAARGLLAGSTAAGWVLRFGLDAGNNVDAALS